MIVAIVQFKLMIPILKEEAQRRSEDTAPIYEDMKGLIRKQYLRGENGMTIGGVYLWESREAAEACYDDTWHERLAGKYGSPPTITWYDCPVVVDNRHNEIVVDKGTAALP